MSKDVNNCMSYLNVTVFDQAKVFNVFIFHGVTYKLYIQAMERFYNHMRYFFFNIIL